MFNTVPFFSLFFEYDRYASFPHAFCKAGSVGNLAHAGITVTACGAIEKNQSVAAVEHQVSRDDAAVMLVVSRKGYSIAILLVAVEFRHIKG